jgi:hypothetical protein
MTSRPIARTVAALAAAVAVVCVPGAALADGADTPAVDVLPGNTHATDPNGGLWFVHRLDAGAHGEGTALLINPAAVPQVVHLYARGVDFSPSGAASVSNDAGAGIASWVHFATPTVTVPPSTRMPVSYDVTVPADADPGDHTGAIVAESGALHAGHVTVIKRIATRFYVTVPGPVVVAFRLDHLRHSLSSPLWPHSVGAAATVVNTGTIRFTPHVTINGHVASGSTLALAHSIEPYTVKLHVPWYGGHLHLRVVATANGGHQQVLTKSFWVIPWVLLAIALIAIGAFVHVVSFIVRRWRRRRAEDRALRERLAQLEAAVPAQREHADDRSQVSR